MATRLNETRDSEWKKTWTGNALLSAPPLPLLAIVGIVVFWLWVSSHLNYNYSAMQTATTNVNLFLLFLPLVLTLIAQGKRLVLPEPSVTRLHDGDAESESSSIPRGWVVSVVMLLVLIPYRLHPIFVIAIVFLYVYLLSASHLGPSSPKLSAPTPPELKLKLASLDVDK
ncbi:DNA-directed RNA polymerase II subunit rpb2 [Spatholobus suberectus]|nr:DNA-directed RNA polymerase II subunit rpb2 [Spatholobus suberectus]